MGMLIKAIIAGVTFFSTISAQALTFGPYRGYDGYQEYRVKPAIFYVSYHLRVATEESGLLLAWRARAAELCKLEGLNYFVELNYSFESVLTSDAPYVSDNSSTGREQIVPAGLIFVPIIVPIPRAWIVATLKSSPAKQGHIRCIANPIDVRNGRQVFEVGSILSEAEKQAWYQKRGR
jgi:hypothetical protein